MPRAEDSSTLATDGEPLTRRRAARAPSGFAENPIDLPSPPPISSSRAPLTARELLTLAETGEPLTPLAPADAATSASAAPAHHVRRRAHEKGDTATLPIHPPRRG